MGSNKPFSGESISVSGLKQLNGRPSLKEYISGVWARRFFILQDSRARAFGEQRDYLLGKFWLIVQPMLDAATYGIIFGFLLRTSRGIDNFIGYLILGITFVGFINKGLLSGNGLLRSQRNLTRSFNFPRATIVVSRSLRTAIDNLLPAAVSVVIAVALQWPEHPGFAVLQIIPIYVLLCIFSCGLTFISARMTGVFPDLRVLVTFFSRIWFYLSCVFYNIEMFDHAPRIKAVIEQNPAYRFVKAMRDVVLDGAWLSLGEWGPLTAWALGTFSVGLVYFWQAEERYSANE